MENKEIKGDNVWL